MIGFVLVFCRGSVQGLEIDVRVVGGGHGGFGAGGAIEVFGEVAKDFGPVVEQLEIHFKGKFQDEEVVDAGLIVVESVGG